MMTFASRVYVHLSEYLCMYRFRRAGVGVFLLALRGKTAHGGGYGSGVIICGGYVSRFRDIQVCQRGALISVFLHVACLCALLHSCSSLNFV